MRGMREKYHKQYEWIGDEKKKILKNKSGNGNWNEKTESEQWGARDEKKRLSSWYGTAWMAGNLIWVILKKI